MKVHPVMIIKRSPWTAVLLTVSKGMIQLWIHQWGSLTQLRQNPLFPLAKKLRLRAERTNQSENEAKRGRMVGRDDLASTPQPLHGHQRGTRREIQGVLAHGPESVMAARPRVAHPELAVEKETETEIETTQDESEVEKGGGGDPGVAQGLDHDLGHGLEQGLTEEGPALDGHLPESRLPRGRSEEAAGGLVREVDQVVRGGGTKALGALRMVSPQKVLQIARAGRRILTG